MEGFLWTNWNIDAEDNRIWFVPFEGHILCGYNLINEKIDKIIFQKFEQNEMASFFLKIWNEKIVIAPFRDNALRVIDRNEEKHYIMEDASAVERYNCAEVCNGDLYLFPRDEKNIIRLYGDCIEFIPSKDNGFVSLISYQDKIWGINRSNKIFMFDPESREMQSFTVKNLDEFVSIIWIGIFDKGCVLTTTNGYVLFAERFDFENTHILGKAPNDDFFRTGIVADDRLILFPFDDATKVYYYDYQKKEIRYNKISDNYSYKWAHDAFGVPIHHLGNIFVMSPKHEALLKLDAFGNLLKKYFISINPEDLSVLEIMDEDVKNNELLFEKRGFWSLDSYVEYLIK